MSSWTRPGSGLISSRVPMTMDICTAFLVTSGFSSNDTPVCLGQGSVLKSHQLQCGERHRFLHALVGDNRAMVCGYGDVGKFCVSPSMVLVIMGSLPVVNPPVVDNKEFVFPGVRVSCWPFDHRSCIGNTTFRSACMATGTFASTSFGRPISCLVYYNASTLPPGILRSVRLCVRAGGRQTLCQ